MYNIVNICINYPASTAVLVLKNLLLFFPTRIIEQTDTGVLPAKKS